MLTAALVGPMLIDWNSFRASFEREASAILGQPVRILGDTDLRLLPVPTVTLERVELGGADGTPIATAARIHLRMDLLPFLSGEIHVSEMTIETPWLGVVVGEDGRVALPDRPTGTVAFDTDRVSLKNVTVTDGAVSFFDARSGTTLDLTDINTNLLEASSMIGPWRVEGSLLCRTAAICGEGGTPATFSLTTGRTTAEGSLRLNIQIIPASPALAGTLITEGTVRSGETGLAYSGNLRFDKLGTTEGGEGLQAGWSLAGAFELDPSRLTLRNLTLDPKVGAITLTGEGTLLFGSGASFTANLAARQIDLNALVDAGPAEPIGAPEAVRRLIERVRTISMPPVPGRISLDVPLLIASGSALQNLSFTVAATSDRWEVEDFAVQLPGRSLLSASGIVTPGEALGFRGSVTLSSEQPSGLIAWWFGEDARSVALDPFSLEIVGTAGAAGVMANTVALDMGPAHAAGNVIWAAATEASGPHLAIDLAATTFDLDQLSAITRLVLPAGPGAGTEATYDLVLSADRLTLGDVAMTNVELEGGLGDRILTLRRFGAGDPDGARIEASGGRIDTASWLPLDDIAATVRADDLSSFVAMARHFVPDSAITSWFERAAPSLVPADLALNVVTNGRNGSLGLGVDGTVGGVSVHIEAAGAIEDIAAGEATMVIDLDAPDTATLLGLTGAFDATPPTAAIVGDGRAEIHFNATGVPRDGMNARIQMQLAGLAVNGSGRLTASAGAPVEFVGPVEINGNDIGPALDLLGIAIPEHDGPTPMVLKAETRIRADLAELAMAPTQSSIAELGFDGNLRFVREEGVWALDGDLNLQAIDLGWLMALPLGVDPTPDDGTDEPWPVDPFAGPALGGLLADIDVAADRLVVSEGITLNRADIGLNLGAAGGVIDLRSATLGGGNVRGTVSAELRDGQAMVAGTVFLEAVPLPTLVWRPDDQPAAEGDLTLTVQFNAAGRSPAGIVASLNGEGTMAINRGAFGFMNPEAFALTTALVDANPNIGEIGLRDAFAGFLDAGRFQFPEANATFSIAGGFVNAPRVIVEGPQTTLTIRTAIDLSRLTVDSNWTLAPVGEPATAAAPRPSVVVSFSGPIDHPERTISVASLASYLRFFQAEERNRLEREALEFEYFLRLIRRTEADHLLAPTPAPAAAPPAPVPTPAPAAPFLLPGADLLGPLIDAAP